MFIAHYFVHVQEVSNESHIIQSPYYSGFTVWIVDAFLMGAAENPVNHGDRLHFMCLYEFKNLIIKIEILPKVLRGVPLAHLVLNEPLGLWPEF